MRSQQCPRPPCAGWIGLTLIASLPLTIACARLNPSFGNDDAQTGTGTGTGTGSSAASTTDGGPGEDTTSDTGFGGESSEVGDSGSSADSSAELCGNGELDAGETCDDGNDDPRDGCVDCVVPASCLDILERRPEAQSGLYDLPPLAQFPQVVEVFCDMQTSGGGYTFYKVASQGSQYAMQAEATCADVGMQLWIPRTPAHLEAGKGVAIRSDFGPSGSYEYLTIMGIRPEAPGSTCANTALNSENDACNWMASDRHGFFVTDSPMGPEPNGDDVDSPVVSMQYLWDRAGNLTDFNDWPALGGSSPLFMCDVGDKF